MPERVRVVVGGGEEKAVVKGSAVEVVAVVGKETLIATGVLAVVILGDADAPARKTTKRRGVQRKYAALYGSF